MRFVAQPDRHGLVGACEAVSGEVGRCGGCARPGYPRARSREFGLFAEQDTGLVEPHGVALGDEHPADDPGVRRGDRVRDRLALPRRRAFYPEAWDRFRDGVPEDERDGDLLAAYSRLMENPDRAIREKAAADWLAWEDAVISNEPNGTPGMYSDREVDAQIAMVRICAHYFSNGAWLAEDQSLRDAHKLAGIPGVLVHGRHDMGCPVQSAWELAKAWPDARLHIIEDSGHGGSDVMSATTRAAIEEFKNR